MNRIQHVTSTLAMQESGTECPIDVATYARGTSESRHAVFAPLHYESNYAYPLLVWLHGGCDNEQQLRRIMPLVSMRNYVAVAPRGTEEEQTRAGRVAYGWSQSPEHIPLAEQRVLASIDDIQQRFHIEPRRVFLAGLADGGTMAYRIALNYPWRFAGVLSIGGAFPAEGCPLRNLAAVREMPIMLTTGRNSRHYPETRVCGDLRLLHSAGMSVTLRQYPSADELTTKMLADMNCWIMERISSSHRSAGVE